MSNPLEMREKPRPTEVVNARTVFHEAQGALRPLLTKIQTYEELDDLMTKLDNIR